jgi:hypothetical protein
MITELILAILCGTGLTVSLTRTQLKAHILGLFFPRFKGQSAEEISDIVAAQWGSVGELINCRYCQSGYFSVLFFGVFSLCTPEIAWLVTAFFATPMFVALVMPEQSVSLELDEELEQRPQTSTPEPAQQFQTPPKVAERMDAMRHNMQAHQQWLRDNPHLIVTLSSGRGCLTPECTKIVEAYRQEMKASNGRPGCTDCDRGRLINKYAFMLDELPEGSVTAQPNAEQLIENAKRASEKAQQAGA